MEARSDWVGVLHRLPPLRWWREQRDAGVRRGLEALRAEVGQRGDAPPSLPDWQLLDEEVSHLLSLLGEQGASLLRLWALRPHGEVSYPQIAARLGALIRALDARRSMHAGDGGTATPGVARLAIPAVASSASGAGGETAPALLGTRMAPVPEKLLPPEAALLATITEKFYASWAFKGIASALVMAVVLAAGGTFLLGGQTIRLSEQLDAAGNKGIATIETIGKAAQASLTHANELLKSTRDAVEKQSTQFTLEVEKAKSDLQVQRTEFANTLKSSSVDQVIGSLRTEIDGKVGPITNRINKEDEDLRKRLAELEKLFTTAQGKLIGLETGLSEAQKGLDALRPKLAPLGTQVSDAGASLMQIAAAERTAATARTATERHEAAARQAESDAAAARDALKMQLGAVANAIPPQQAALAEITAAAGSLRPALASATEAVAEAGRDAAALRAAALSVSSLGAKIAALDKLIADLQAVRAADRLAALESRTPTPPSTPPAIERQLEALNEAERCAIQHQLLALNFLKAPGNGKEPIDGQLGAASRAAMQGWQRSIGALDDGNLTSAQIERLIGTGAVPACPPKAVPPPRRVARR